VLQNTLAKIWVTISLILVEKMLAKQSRFWRQFVNKDFVEKTDVSLRQRTRKRFDGTTKNAVDKLLFGDDVGVIYDVPEGRELRRNTRTLDDFLFGTRPPSPGNRGRARTSRTSPEVKNRKLAASRSAELVDGSDDGMPDSMPIFQDAPRGKKLMQKSETSGRGTSDRVRKAEVRFQGLSDAGSSGRNGRNVRQKSAAAVLTDWQRRMTQRPAARPRQNGIVRAKSLGQLRESPQRRRKPELAASTFELDEAFLPESQELLDEPNSRPPRKETRL
jgi:hypothetical protein